MSHVNLHISKLQINTSMKYYWTERLTLLSERLKSETRTTPNAGEDVKSQEASSIAGGNTKRYNIWKTVWWCLTKLSRSSSNCTPWYLPKGPETLCPHKTCTWMFIAALFMVAKTWKQPRCPLVAKWINKLWCIHTMGCYSVRKRNELSSHAGT